MSFATLVSHVFRYGCGVGMRTAMRDSDYLCKYEQGLRPALPDDTALAALLGGKLADRAFRNMPWQLRQRIGEWNDGVESQLQLLRDICQQLNSWRWRRTGRRSYSYNSDVRCVLPASMGSWQRGKVQPNCLGIAQMMVGFAQAVGALHWLANAIQANQDTLLQYEIRALQMVETMMRQFPDFGDYAEGVKQAYWEALESANRPQQAHHLLVVQLADGSWWVVDPYLGALYALKDHDKQETIADWITRNPDRTAILRPSTPVGDYIDRINQRMHALQFACSVFNGRFGDQPELADSALYLLSYIAGYIQTATMPSDHESFAMQLAHVEIAVDDPNQDTQKLEEAAMIALIHAMHDEDMAALSATINKDPEAIVSHFVEQMARAAEDFNFEKELSLRLIRYILQDFLQYLEDLHNDPDTRQHSCLEITWAPLGIGVATLNHVQCTELPGSAGQSKMPNLEGKLAAIFPGQWILHDALALARQRGEPIHPDYLTAIMQRLADIRSIPEMTIDPLKLLDTD